MLFSVCGDLHGRFEILSELTRKLKKNGVSFLICLGDSAFVSTDRKEYLLDLFKKRLFMRGVDNIKSAVEFLRGKHQLEIPVYFINGNHEDFPYLSIFENSRPVELKKNFFYLGRSGFVNLFGTKILFLSSTEPGKEAIYRSSVRIQPFENHRFFFKEEVEKVLKVKGKIDIFISHDVPKTNEGSAVVRRIIEEKKPKFSFHSHFHSFKTGNFIHPLTLTVLLKPIFLEKRSESLLVLRKEQNYLEMVDAFIERL